MKYLQDIWNLRTNYLYRNCGRCTMHFDKSAHLYVFRMYRCININKNITKYQNILTCPKLYMNTSLGLLASMLLFTCICPCHGNKDLRTVIHTTQNTQRQVVMHYSQAGMHGIAYGNLYKLQHYVANLSPTYNLQLLLLQQYNLWVKLAPAQSPLVSVK